ncbi:MAG: carbon monoxide dehydrogenase subunit G [Haloarculaceae archaeon]|jgi:carbon monoxide dehydrogenase subunit G
MEFSGEFELSDVPPDDAWIMLSDPVAVRNSLKGCRYITPMDDEFSFEDYEAAEGLETLPKADPEEVVERVFEEGVTYAALMQVGVGSVKPRFESQITIDERDGDAYRMRATGGGSASSSNYELEAWMEITETDDGSAVEWGAETDIAGRIAQLGNRVIDPVADKIVNNFFTSIEQQMSDVEETDTGITSRIRSMI